MLTKQCIPCENLGFKAALYMDLKLIFLFKNVYIFAVIRLCYNIMLLYCVIGSFAFANNKAFVVCHVRSPSGQIHFKALEKHSLTV